MHGVSMSDISQVQMQRFKDTEMKRASNELNTQKDVNNREYKKIVNTNEGVINDLRKGYDTQVDGLKNELEQKLLNARGHHDEVIKGEEERMAQELVNLKRKHIDQVQEIKTAQQGQIDDLNISHKNTLDNARQKFLKSKAKWET